MNNIFSRVHSYCDIEALITSVLKCISIVVRGILLVAAKLRIESSRVRLSVIS